MYTRRATAGTENPSLTFFHLVLFSCSTQSVLVSGVSVWLVAASGCLHVSSLVIRQNSRLENAFKYIKHTQQTPHTYHSFAFSTIYSPKNSFHLRCRRRRRIFYERQHKAKYLQIIILNACSFANVVKALNLCKLKIVHSARKRLSSKTFYAKKCGERASERKRKCLQIVFWLCIVLLQWRRGALLLIDIFQ